MLIGKKYPIKLKTFLKSIVDIQFLKKIWNFTRRVSKFLVRLKGSEEGETWSMVVNSNPAILMRKYYMHKMEIPFFFLQLVPIAPPLDYIAKYMYRWTSKKKNRLSIHESYRALRARRMRKITDNNVHTNNNNSTTRGSSSSAERARRRWESKVSKENYSNYLISSPLLSFLCLMPSVNESIITNDPCRINYKVLLWFYQSRPIFWGLSVKRRALKTKWSLLRILELKQVEREHDGVRSQPLPTSVEIRW